MKVCMKLAFDEHAALRLLNWLAQENARILKARPDLPGLYASGVRYQREPDEVWCDYLTLLAVGLGLCLTMVAELVTLKYDLGRMNTVFKFYYVAWALLAVSSSVCLWWIATRRSNRDKCVLASWTPTSVIATGCAGSYR